MPDVDHQPRIEVVDRDLRLLVKLLAQQSARDFVYELDAENSSVR